MARLVLMRGQTDLLHVSLKRGRTLIGRSDASDLVVPHSDVSRTHCVVDAKDSGWTVTDRSRHGTTLNGVAVGKKACPLSDGDLIGVADYLLRFSTQTDEAEATHSVTSRGVPAEKLVATDDGVCVQRVVLVVDDGSDAGRRVSLTRSRTSIGGKGSRVVLEDPTLVREHVNLDVVHGRPMLVPGKGTAVIDGEHVAYVTPVYFGEPVGIGATVFHLEEEVVVEQDERDSFGDMVGVDAASRQLFAVLRRMAAHTAPVLLVGESGTGKELAARGLHDNSLSAGGPFIAVNCGAIQESLFESELFGHEKGAFTGAVHRKDGAFHLADGGTLFLDELGELPESAQAKLLRALESGEVRRVGGFDVSYPRVRVVAATNLDLEKAVEAGTFRSDLYFRLAVLAMRLPPLRQRLDDLEIICQELCRKIGAGVRVMPDAIGQLRTHEFPGNVRELRNILTRAFVLHGPVITAPNISFNPWGLGRPGGRVEIPDEVRNPDSLDPLTRAELAVLIRLMTKHSGNRSAVSRDLGIARSTLHYKLKIHKLDDVEFE
ncbi:MAG: FHA domain-containing protein [Proteobacteria bacterium]|nr:FHA domain-containing protein [Pseudomonadota bacterium]MCP4915848.1 FHA domain-containing protein [Pseudomonadota bacterium]